MFGFSLPKLLFTAAAIALVIYGFRWISQMQQRKQQNVQNRSSARKPAGPAASSRSNAAADDVETMIECKVCNAYVAASGARSCGRDDCPYPG